MLKLAHPRTKNTVCFACGFNFPYISSYLFLSANVPVWRTEWVEVAQNFWSLGLVIFHCVGDSAISDKWMVKAGSARCKHSRVPRVLEIERLWRRCLTCAACHTSQSVTVVYNISANQQTLPVLNLSIYPSIYSLLSPNFYLSLYSNLIMYLFKSLSFPVSTSEYAVPYLQYLLQFSIWISIWLYLYLLTTSLSIRVGDVMWCDVVSCRLIFVWCHVVCCDALSVNVRVGNGRWW